MVCGLEVDLMVSLSNHKVVAKLECPTSWSDKLTMRSQEGRWLP